MHEESCSLLTVMRARARLIARANVRRANKNYMRTSRLGQSVKNKWPQIAKGEHTQI